MRYFELVKDNGESRYYYLDEIKIDINKTFPFINFLDELEMESNFWAIQDGLFVSSDKPFVNNTLTKKTSYVEDANIKDCIKSYCACYDMREINYIDYCLAKLIDREKMNKDELLEVANRIINSYMWDGNITSPKKLIKTYSQECLRNIYLELLDAENEL